jgi:hypothetical protein
MLARKSRYEELVYNNYSLSSKIKIESCDSIKGSRRTIIVLAGKCYTKAFSIGGTVPRPGKELSAED